MIVVDIAIKSIVVSMFAIGLTLLLRRASSATRHLAIAISLVALCAIPAAEKILPAWSVPFIKVPSPPKERMAHETTRELPIVSSIPVAGNVSVSPQMDPDSALWIVWGSVAAMLALRVAYRLGRLKRLEQSLPMCAQPELQLLVAEYCRRYRRHFLLLEGEAGEPPMTWGHNRPVLLLPSAAKDWSAERLRSVLLHELAHVERGDWAVSVVSELICALFWFNPLVWVLRKRLELESESAADDRVLTLGVAQTEYATHLVELLRDLNRFPSSAGAAVAMARPGPLDSRVRAILEQRRSRRTVHGGVVVGLLASTLAVVGIVGAAVPAISTRAESRTTELPVTQIPTPSIPTPSPALSQASSAPTRAALDSRISTVTAATARRIRRSSITRLRRTLENSAKALARESSSYRLKRALALASPKLPPSPVFADSKENERAEQAAKALGDALLVSNIAQIQVDVKRAMNDARVQMRTEGMKRDISELVSRALDVARSSLKASKASRAKETALAAQALKSVSEQLKALPKKSN